MKVFLAGTSLSPSYGGPAFSVSQLALALTDVGVEVGLWTSDQSAVSSPLLPAGSAVRRLAGDENEALQAFGRPDIVHDNGIWLWHNHRLAMLAARLGVPRVVSTRGMLEPWAMNHRKWKKFAAWRLYQRQDLERANCLHATAEEEARSIRDRIPKAPISTIPNGVDVAESALGASKSEPRIMLFLGRLHSKKGLLMLVEAWARVRPEGWCLKIVGPDEGGHRAQVERAIAAAGLGVTVHLTGPLEGEAKESAFLQASVFVLPTYSENFGIAIAEALAHGLPVLTTTGAPWPMLPARGCGWVVEPNVDEMADALRNVTSCGPARLQEMGAKGRAFVKAEFGWKSVAQQFVSTYEGIAVNRKHLSQ